MANEEHVAKLKKGVEAWNQWRKENIKAFYQRQIDQDHPEIINPDLSMANLRKADLSGANLIWADLHEADLRNASLVEATLIQADLRGADLRGAFLGGANLDKAILCGANLSHAALYRTIFGDTDLTDVKGLESCGHTGPSIIDYHTLQRSGSLPLTFLRGCGLPDTLIDYLPSLFSQPIQYYSCFISYSHNDKAFAQRIYDALQVKGIRCWFDKHDIPRGADVHEEIDFGIRIWDKVLLCCSKDSLTSWWVDNEIETAFAKERQIMEERKQKVLALIPLDLDGYLFSDDFKSGKKQQLHSRSAADFRDWKHSHDKFEQELNEVIKALQFNRGRKPPPEPKL